MFRKLIYEKEKTRDEFNAKVAEGLGRLKGIEAALNGTVFIIVIVINNYTVELCV